MRFESIHATDLGPFKRVDVDFTKLAGPLVAVTGPNGAGKSTLLELLTGALYRQCPTRGTLADLATSRNASVEVKVVNGAAYTVRQTIDAISKKGESLVLDAGGAPVLDSGKVRQYDDWAATHFPSPAILYTGPIAVQGRRGFLDRSPAERKQVLLEVLQIERLVQLADAARERAREHMRAAEQLRARLGELGAPDLAALQLRALEASDVVSKAVEALALARKALERGKAAAGDAARAAELREQRAAVEKRLTTAREQLQDLETRIANNRGMLERADEIAAAVARTAELQALLDTQGEAAAGAKGAVDVASAELDALTKNVTRAKSAEAEAQVRLTRVLKRLADRDAVLEAVAALPPLQLLEQETSKTIGLREGEIVELERVLIGGKDTRITGLRDALTEIGKLGDTLGVRSGEALRTDDKLAERGAQAPKLLEEARAALTKHRRSLESLRQRKAEHERLAARAGDITAAEAEHEAGNAELVRSREDLARAQADEKASRGKLEQARTALVAARAEVEKTSAAIAELAAVVKLAPRVEQAQGRIEELTAQLEPAQQQISAAEAELAALPVIEAESVDLQTLERAVLAAEAAERAGRERSALAQQAIAAAEEVLERRAALQLELDQADVDVADYTRLGMDLGRDGLQAMEIDAAIPELNTLANALLHSCHGPRFTVELRTDRLSADGKRTLEGLDVRVVDTEHGRDDIAETYSGGECVIVGCALSLALTTLACRRSGIEGPTLCMDEAGAALDAENGRAWIAMLRLAAKEIRADKVIYVSHVPELQDLADSKIVIADGAVALA